MVLTTGALLGGAAIAGGASLLGSGIGALINKKTADENFELQQKNLDYQKAVQQQIFEREDTAIQRRKDDLMKAGMNPYLAAQGNGAGAGSVVSTSAPQYGYMSGNDIQKMFGSIGAAVDMYKAMQQVKQDDLYTRYMEMQNEKSILDLNNSFNYYMSTWGKYDDKLHDFNYPWSYLPGRINNMNLSPISGNGIQNSFPYLSNLYGSDMQKVSRDFAVSDKIESYIMDGIDALTSGSNAARGWYRDYGNQHFNGYTPHGYTDYFESHRSGWRRTRNYN